tara:strand:- start:1373 stop:1939 length:567 start_codon:yes stop_codon:yes gene_type:complete
MDKRIKMNINEITQDGLHKVCDVVNKLTNDRSQTSKWSIIWDKNTNPKLLSNGKGRCYFIVVNDIIYKIGFSDSNGGIRNTWTSYKGGNGGRPSDRTYGIHHFIKNELKNDSKIEIYFLINDTIKVQVPTMFGYEEVEDSVSGKHIEKLCLKQHKERYGCLPKWNLQEQGEDWPNWVQIGLTELKGKR